MKKGGGFGPRLFLFPKSGLDTVFILFSNPDYHELMIVAKGHGILAQSVLEPRGICPFVVKYMLSEYRANKTAQILWLFKTEE